MKARKKPPLWFYGLICMCAGPIASQLLGSSPSGPLTDQQQGEAEGRAFAVILLMVVGLVLIIISIVKNIRSRRMGKSLK
jgi:hypothetical protein